MSDDRGPDDPTALPEFALNHVAIEHERDATPDEEYIATWLDHTPTDAREAFVGDVANLPLRAVGWLSGEGGEQ